MRIENSEALNRHFPDIDGFWDFANLDQTEVNIRAQLPNSFENLTPQNIEFLTQLGRLQGLQGRLPEARKTLELCVQKVSALSGPERTRPEIRCLLELGRQHCLERSPVRAQDLLAQAWTLALKNKEIFFAIDAALILTSIVAPKAKNEWLQRAVTVAEESPSEHTAPWLARLYLMDGWNFFDLRQFDKALERFKFALDRPRIKGDTERNFVARWSLARTYRAMGQVQEAYDLQQNLLLQATEAGLPPNGHVYLELAECMQLLNQTEEAKPFFENAHKILSADPWYADNRSSELARIHYLYKKRH